MLLLPRSYPLLLGVLLGAAEPPAPPGGAACYEPGALVPGHHGRWGAPAGLPSPAACQVLFLPQAGAGKALQFLYIFLSLSLSRFLSFCFDSAFSLITSDHLMLCHSAAEWLTLSVLLQ